ncbi:MAG TPA: RsmB/NOP family class I SAM-dependent RNA methyltransferase [Rhabdochlamydiaceae bacterium]|jgi:16S rRNA C967 or C1407 C5-methylase (RsmB/RsmF family)|nr:RsmB/NOP family class I SAM-dependent RNA methyltransferase [Rhabdochlamydiaceae bacterium]
MKFRQYHLSAVLESLESEKIPLDALLSRYFRQNKALGSKDRLFISDTLYHYIRWKNLYQHLKIDPSPLDPLSYLHDGTIPTHVRYGMPQDLYDLLVIVYGKEKTHEISLVSNTRAPLTIRVNPLKITREKLLEKWSGTFKTAPCPCSSLGIHFLEKINFFTLPEYLDGLFEIQDEASQMAADLVKTGPKQHVLDYCAGAGGKTLAFAHRLENSGQIYLHDIRPRPLQEARKRLSRAGVQNVQFSLSARQKNKMDWVVVDVPCTGTGTFRRNPDLKWKFDASRLESLIEEQRKIFHESFAYLHPQGTIVYMTCSILPQENEQQAAFFQKNYGLEVVEIFQTLPKEGGMDGFFAIALKRNSSI